MGGSSSTLPDVQTKWFPEFEKTLPSLEGKTICVTGCTSGTGYIVARTAIRKGASRILLLNRPSDRATKAEDSLKAESSSPKTIETIPCDLQDFDSVRSAIESIKTKCDSIDVLCNNAGVMALEDIATKDGYDVQMQTNHLSHFLLTKELFPLLTKAAEVHGDARVCNHSSEARKYKKTLDAQYFGRNGGNLGGNGNNFLFGRARWVRYSQTKLANSVFSTCLADRFQKYPGLKSVCAHPGLASTNLSITTEKDGGLSSGKFNLKCFVCLSC
jgi:Dehydrogenases with different specificities (related to short-chain alcohol dehydrogenases)